MYISSTGVYNPYKGNSIDEDTKLVLNIPEDLTHYPDYEQEFGVIKGN